MSEKIVRFSVAQRLEHFAIMSLFTILTVTGFPQKFWSAGWAQSFSPPWAASRRSASSTA